MVSAQRRSQGLRGDAQHVDVGIGQGLVSAAGAGVEVHALGGSVATEGGHDLRPQEPRRSQLGNLHKELRPDGQVKPDARRGRGDINAALD